VHLQLVLDPTKLLFLEEIPMQEPHRQLLQLIYISSQ